MEISDSDAFIISILILAVFFLLFQHYGKERDLPPAHYNVEITSFKKLFPQASSQRYESGLFEAGGYKWRLIIYPNGNITDGGDGHISLYLKIDECNVFSDNWTVHVNYKFFLQDRTTNTFINFQDAAERRFDRNKKEWGFGQYVSHGTFNKPSNRLLVNDSCAFGAEVFVIKSTGKGETVSVVENPPGRIQTWKIKEFSKLDGIEQSSHEYIVRDRKWRLRLYPKGTAEGKDQFLAISLALVDCNDRPPKKEVYANFKLRIVGEDDWEKENWKWFSTRRSSYDDWEFIKLEKLCKRYNGFLVDDTLTIELQFLSISDVSFH